MSRNRMQQPEVPEELEHLPEPAELPDQEPPAEAPVEAKAAKPGQCPKCGQAMAVVTERIVSNGIVRQYRCPKCNKFVTV